MKTYSLMKIWNNCNGSIIINMLNVKYNVYCFILKDILNM